MKRAAALGAILFFFSSAVGAREQPLGRRLAHRAAGLVGHRSLREVAPSLTDDCSGLARYIYRGAGIELVPSGAGHGSLAAAIHRRAKQGKALSRQAHPGDLVFFRETYDRNRDGKRNDGITHLGVVESVSAEGIVTFVHRTSAGIVRSRLDQRHPRLRRDRHGQVHNDVLRRAGRSRRAYVAGELVAGFASAARMARLNQRPRPARAQAGRRRTRGGAGAHGPDRDGGKSPVASR